jgi:hypothetical protein
MEEIEYIKNNYGLDFLKDLNMARDLFKTFFLLGFVIVDSAAEISYFLFDGYNDYQKYSFNSLERENKNTGNEVKSLVNLMRKL